MGNETIADLEAEAKFHDANLKNLASSFKEETISMLQTFWVEGGRKLLVNEPDKLEALSDAELSELKDDLKDIGEEMKTLVRSELDDEKLWYHKKRGEYRTHIQKGASYRPQLEFIEAVQLLAGNLSHVFDRHGITGLKSFVFETRGRQGNQIVGVTRFIGDELKWTAGMRRILQEYEETILELMQVRRRLAAERLMLEKNKAEERWDKN